MEKQLNCIGRNMSIINKHLKIFLKNKFSNIDLSSTEVMMLLTINGSYGISQEGINEYLGYDKAVITRRIKNLLESGYINRQKSIEDKRSYHLKLTDKGKQLIPLIFRNLTEWNELITEGIPNATVELVSKNLEQIARNAVRNSVPAQHGE